MTPHDEPSVWADHALRALDNAQPVQSYGRVSFASGPIVRASGQLRIGEVCRIPRPGLDDLLAEVVGFSSDEAILSPYGSLAGLSRLSAVIPLSGGFDVPVGPELLGRVVDGLGRPFDGRGPIGCRLRYPGHALPPDPMRRPVIDRPFELGVRALDGLLTCGLGQRMGIFAAAGGGKSTLLSMLVRFAKADTIVIALIGERGREVREFVEHQLGEDGLRRSVLVIATSDRPAIEQVKAAYSATAIAEYFRDQGQDVLLLMDSLTRFARAQRQIGLAAGEPPTRRGFPPSVFEKLPGLVERTGRSPNGSITALYTVLMEGDDMNEPVSDEVRSLLDGHIILSRKLAQQNHYPAIDVLASASRVLGAITDAGHRELIGRVRELLAKYDEVELLVRIGEYTEGQDALTDRALRSKPAIDGFLRQALTDTVSFAETKIQLARVLS